MSDPSISDLIGAAGGGGGATVALVLLVQRFMKKNGTYVSEQLCRARIATIEAKLDGLEDKVDAILSLIRNGGTHAS